MATAGTGLSAVISDPRGCTPRVRSLRARLLTAPAEITPERVEILQAAVREFCENGAFERHIARMHRVYRKRMAAALQSLRRHIKPEWAEWNEPAGGYLIWLTLKPGPSAR